MKMEPATKVESMLKFLVYASIYLIISIPIFVSVSAAESVEPVLATGDLSTAIDVLTIPGINGLDYKLTLSYSGGDGIPLLSGASWVGLGWSLEPDEISRSVVGYPDDLNTASAKKEFQNTHVSGIYNEIIDTRSWWEKFGQVILFFVAIAINVALNIALPGSGAAAINTFWDFLLSTATHMVFSLIMTTFKNVLSAVIMGQSPDMSLSWVDLATSFIMSSAGPLDQYTTEIKTTVDVGPLLVTNVGSGTLSTIAVEVTTTVTHGLKDVINTMLDISEVMSKGQAAYAMLQLPGQIDATTSSLGDSDIWSERFSPKGFLYDPLDNELVVTDPVDTRDAGKPDVYSASGIFSGPLIPGSKFVQDGDSYKPISLPSATGRKPEDYLQFYPQKMLGIEAAKVDYKTDLPETCDSFIKSPKHGTKSELCKKYQSYIDQIIVTSSDGTRIIYGDPHVAGSIIREHKSERTTVLWAYGDDSEHYFKDYSYSETHHPVMWKVISILGADYPKTQPVYPLDVDVSTLKGSWIAFKYDDFANFRNPDRQCAFVVGDRRGMPTSHPWSMEPEDGTRRKDGFVWSAISKDISYLSEIHTPTHVAKFTTSPRTDLDSKEGAYFDQLVNHKLGSDRYYMGGPTTLFWDGSRNLGAYGYILPDTQTCEKNQNVVKKKLDKISLWTTNSKGVPQKLESKVTFSGQNELRPKLEYPDTVGTYTLKSVTYCGEANGEICIPPYEFEYYNYPFAGESP